MAAGRKVTEHIPGWLTVYDDGFVDRSWTKPLQFKFMSDPVPPHDHFVDGVSTHDLTLHNIKPDFRVRVYLPELPETQKLPIILHFHGGGFCITQPDWFRYYYIYTRTARESGAIVVSPYLPLAPEHCLPAAIDDGYATLLWLQDLANQKTHDPLLSTRVDFNRVFLIGDSSGANIVHQVAKISANENMIRLAGAILIQPVFLRSMRSKSELEKPQSLMFTLDMLDRFLMLALPVGSTKDHPITCPMNETVAGLDLPPYLLCVAEDDLVIDNETEFYEGMKNDGKKIELLVSNGVGHTFYLNKVAIDADPNTSMQTQKLIEGISHFVGNH
ncbi:putative carboxylesterase 17 [Bidens hawaiensis]|uniref:putative carboxylesterase 17 n=1 Tax=Bidens hawaiensis TaxID=980011 RepID=UPI00404A94EA